MYQLYGIPNCNTVKKARDFMKEKGLEYEFINFKKQAPKKIELKRWKAFFNDWPVNTKGLTFRKYKEDFLTASPEKKWNIMIENSSMIKRPILENNGKVLAMGFKESHYLEVI